MQENSVLAFNVGDKAVVDKVITTNHITFTTYFKKTPQSSRIVLPIASWIVVRIKETGQQFDLSFPEQLSSQPLNNLAQNIWPQGISLYQVITKEREKIVHNSVSTDERKNVTKGGLTLVWSNSDIYPSDNKSNTPP